MSQSKINVNDLNIILDALLNKPNSMINHHIDSANTFYEQGILQIMSKGFKIFIEVNNERNETEEERNIIKYSINIDITAVKLTPPETLNYDTLKSQLLTPNEACIKDLTYSSPMYVDATITATSFHTNGSTSVKTANVENYKISKIPVMVKSKLCNLYDKSKETLIQLHEDPNDIGGFFIVKGNEYIIDSLESMTFNAPREFRNIGHKTELTRGDLISKAGDYFENSTNLISRLLKNFLLTFEISNNKFKDIQIPFYLLFRALGLTSDQDIMEHIMYSLDKSNPKIELMHDILEKAFEAKYNLFDARYTYNQNDVLDLIGGFINSQYAKSENTKRYTVDVVLQILDKDVLPHIGLTSESRYKKIRYLGYLLNRVLLTYLEIIPSTDRDSYKNKRISSAGISYAKVFKTQFNFAVVNPLKKAFLVAFKNYNFNHIDLVSVFNSAINGSDFERALIQAITTGDKMISIKRTKVPNRLSSQQLHRKNQINVYSTLRNVNTSNTSSTKQSARANEMRRFHPSMTGYICCVQSADTGESVGMQKQMAISAKICLPNSSEVLKTIINNDDDLIKLDKKLLNETIFKLRLTKVFVNGDWLGCVKNMYVFANKYRNLRREQKINYLTTVTTDNLTNEINFWVDVGRITRPLIMVNNNTNDKDYTHAKFRQWINLTQDHLNKLNRLEIDFDYLIENQIVEYIAAEEQENILICSDIDLLYENETNPLKQFTHLDIAAAIIGIPGLTSPLANHNQVARVVFQTNQVKQTCGIPSMAWPYKTYKDMHLQYYNEMPLVKTIVNKYIVPTGANAIVAIAIYTGFNQEDSIIVNQSSVDRGLFTTSYFTYEKTELDKNEEFMTPNPLETEDMKAYSNYEKLVNGLVPIGTYVEHGDIIIGKVSRINKNNVKDGILYSDHSMVYKKKEPSYVWDVIISRNEESNKVCKIVFRSIRKCAIGDKFSARSGQKATVGILLNENDMPFTKSGMKPDILFNPMSLPTRMTMGSLFEAMIAKVAAHKGVIVDHTMFKKLDLEGVTSDLKKCGFEDNGTERLFNGLTGKYMDAKIFMGPMSYQKLQRFTVDTVYSHQKTPTDALTRQPLEGKSASGGQKLGEMELHCLATNSVNIMHEKVIDHSDKFDIYICKNCSKQAIVNQKYNIYKCNYCKENADIVMVNSTWSAKQFYQELETCNIGIKFKIKDNKYTKMIEAEKI